MVAGLKTHIDTEVYLLNFVECPILMSFVQGATYSQVSKSLKSNNHFITLQVRQFYFFYFMFYVKPQLLCRFSKYGENLVTGSQYCPVSKCLMFT